MYVFDSNVYLGVFLKEHIFQENATNLFTKINENIILPHIILSEVLTILTYKEGKEKSNKVLNFLETDNRFVIIHTDIEESLLFRKKLNKKIAYADSVLIYTSIKYLAKLETYDKQLRNIYNNLLKK